MELYKQYDEERVLIENSVSAGIQKNIFLVKSDLVDPIGYNGKIVLKDPVDVSDPPPYALCFPARNGYFNFSLTGKGKYVMIQ
jgi:hypothetical protein